MPTRQIGFVSSNVLKKVPDTFNSPHGRPPCRFDCFINYLSSARRPVFLRLYRTVSLWKCHSWLSPASPHGPKHLQTFSAVSSPHLGGLPDQPHQSRFYRRTHFQLLCARRLGYLPRSPEEHDYGSVARTFKFLKRVLDIYVLSALARPAAIGQLLCSVRWPFGICV